MWTESYVIRIYRRGGANRRALVGIVESAHSGWQKPFQSLDELADILNRAPQPRRRPAPDDPI
jgi:hypothetical protein